MKRQVVTILTSGMGLGVYIPALLIADNIQRHNIDVEILVAEEYFTDIKKEKLLKNKKAFHKSFKVTLLGHRMAKGDVTTSFKLDKIDELLSSWEAKQRDRFLIISGNWARIVDRYYEKMLEKNIHIDVEAIRMDADVAPSWRQFNNKHKYNEVWLFDYLCDILPYKIPVQSDGILPLSQREDRYVIHGGGWGLGTYLDKINELNDANLALDVVIYNNNEIVDNAKNRYYMMDPEWNPWIRKNGKFIFPPTYQVIGDRREKINKDYHAIYDIYKNSKGIISKPGGGTLVDSIASATPLIFIDPIAPHEVKNAELWVRLGFGIYLEEWKQSGYSSEIIEKLHNNLVEATDKIPDYIKDYCDQRKEKVINE